MIPYPEFKSHLFTRTEITSSSKEEIVKKYRAQPSYAQASDAMISRLAKFLKILRKNRFWVLYRVVSKVFRIYFRIFHRLDIRGIENIPSKGCIFITNHPGSFDPLIVMAALDRPMGMFTSFGNGWVADALEKHLGYIKREGTKEEMLEKIIRQILLHNSYFLIAPSGLQHTTKIQEGYTGVVNVYSVINHDKDRLPIVPIILQNSECYHGSAKMKNGVWPQIRINFLPSYYLPREWLLPKEQGGKTPREMINWIMLSLAHKLGQKEVAKNPGLEQRRTHHESTWKKSEKKKAMA